MTSRLSLPLLLLPLCLASCSGSASGAAPPKRLEVDSEHWPVRVLELGQATIRLVDRRGVPAYLTKIEIQLAQDSSTPTAVSYVFYEPAKRSLLTVSYVNAADVSVSAQVMEQARRAGVDKIMRAAQDAAIAPQFDESALREGAFAPAPLPGAQVGLRDAYALARREGLTRAENIDLSVSDKDPKLPLLMWTFKGQHTREDSQAIHIDAITGAYIDEDRINSLSRAERAAQLDAGLAVIKAFLRAHQGGSHGGDWSSPLIPGAASVVNGGGEHGYYFDGLRDYTLGPASDCAARGGTDAGPASFGGNYCY